MFAHTDPVKRMLVEDLHVLPWHFYVHALVWERFTISTNRHLSQFLNLSSHVTFLEKYHGCFVPLKHLVKSTFLRRLKFLCAKFCDVPNSFCAGKMWTLHGFPWMLSTSSEHVYLHYADVSQVPLTVVLTIASEKVHFSHFPSFRCRCFWLLPALFWYPSIC